MLYKAVINLPPVTKKNHSQILINQKTKKPFIMPSRQYQKYEQAAGYFLKPMHINEPVNVKCLFYMPTKRKVDIVNLLQCVDDILVHHGVLEDDNSNIVVSHDGSRVLYSKEEPRTEIYIERSTND